jgi:hypothetical protein
LATWILVGPIDRPHHAGGDYDAHDHIIVIEFEIRRRYRRLLAFSRRTPLSFLAEFFFLANFFTRRTSVQGVSSGR